METAFNEATTSTMQRTCFHLCTARANTRESIVGTALFSARYTITYRDMYENKYANIFDFNHGEQI